MQKWPVKGEKWSERMKDGHLFVQKKQELVCVCVFVFACLLAFAEDIKKN